MSTREAPSPAAEADPSPSPRSPAKGSRPPARGRNGRSSTARRRTIVYDDQARRSRKNERIPVEVRRVRRVVRRVDTWSLFRFSVLLYLCFLIVLMVSVVGLWLVASASGAIPSIENFITQLFALKSFHFKAVQLFAGTFALGLIWVIAATMFTTIFGVLYNLITDVVGGIEITVLEEEPLEVIG